MKGKNIGNRGNKNKYKEYHEDLAGSGNWLDVVVEGDQRQVLGGVDNRMAVLLSEEKENFVFQSEIYMKK